MSDRKPRKDSTLKTLPEERQAQIYELMLKDGLTAARKQLAQDGIETSEAALSGFGKWWRAQQQFNRAAQLSDHLVELLKQEQPGLTQDALDRYGQRVFQMRALDMEESDPEGAALIWHRMQKLSLQSEVVKLERQKFQRETCRLFVQWSQDAKAKEIATSSGLSETEKIQQLGQFMFGDLWEEADAPAAKKGK